MKFTSIFVLAALLSTSNAIQSTRSLKDMSTPVSLAQIFTDATREPSYPRYEPDNNGAPLNKDMVDSCRNQLKANEPCHYATIPSKWDKESDANVLNKEMKNDDIPALTLHDKPKDTYSWVKNMPLSIHKYNDYMGKDA